MSTLVSHFILPLDIDTFIDIFWTDSSWYERFLTEKLQDLSVDIGEWFCEGNSPGDLCKTRKIKSDHPSKISFPGLPSHAESFKTQTLTHLKEKEESRVIIKESNTFKGIPYADYFNVNTEW